MKEIVYQNETSEVEVVTDGELVVITQRYFNDYNGVISLYIDEVKKLHEILGKILKEENI